MICVVSGDIFISWLSSTDPTPLRNNPTHNFLQILADLDQAFSLQLYRVGRYLYPPTHATGSRKPDMGEQETKLLRTEDWGPEDEQ